MERIALTERVAAIIKQHIVAAHPDSTHPNWPYPIPETTIHRVVRLVERQAGYTGNDLELLLNPVSLVPLVEEACRQSGGEIVRLDGNPVYFEDVSGREDTESSDDETTGERVESSSHERHRSRQDHYRIRTSSREEDH